MEELSVISSGAFALLGLGLIFGFKHAMEVDHVVAVSAIVSEHRNLLRATLVGGFWGIGHTISLLAVGLLVLVFRVVVPETVANWLEFGVALMIVALGVLALWRVFRQRANVHVHEHSHNGRSHVHIHFHEQATAHTPPVSKAPSHSHVISKVGLKPVLVGAMHGLAGSAALTLLVLSQIQSVAKGLLYLFLFGIGSTVGMLLMSGVIGLPFALSKTRLTGINAGLQTAAGAISIVFGVWYAYASGVTRLW